MLFLFLSFLPVSQCGIIFGPELPRFVVHPPEGRINFTITEDYENYDSVDEPFIKLSTITEQYYGNGCFSLLSEINIIDNNVIVRIHGIKELIGNCQAIYIQAKYSEKLFLENGDYNLLFYYNNNVDSYFLTVTDSMIQIKLDTSEIMSNEQETYWRYPKNSFAYFLNVRDSSTYIYEDFIDTLTTNLTITEFQFPDFGKNPYEDLNQSQHINYFPLRFFTYENEEEFEKAGEILKSYTENVIGNNFFVSLILINWKNRRFTARQFMER